MGGALDRFVLPLLVDAWIEQLIYTGRAEGWLIVQDREPKTVQAS